MRESYSIDDENRLVAKSSAGVKTIEGRWSLNQDYDLEFLVRDVDKPATQEVITFRGEIICAENNRLVFESKAINANGEAEFKTLFLSGEWGVDEHNRIIFKACRKNNSPDIVTLQGGWELNNHQQIVYTYEKTDLKTKDKIKQNIIFTGFWEISESSKLSYIFSKGTQTRFDFRAQLESPNFYPKEGVIKYRIGVGVKEPLPQAGRVISLYGAWKFSRNLGISFEMEYEKGQFHAAHFGAEADLSKEDEIVLSLNNARGEPLGFNLTFTHKFLRQSDIKAFVRFRKLRREYGVDTGISIPF